MVDRLCTPGELLEVMMLFAPPPLALAAVERAFVALDSDGAPIPLSERPLLEGIEFTEDTLILLSLLSEDANERVERHLAAQRGGPRTADEQERWDRRRTALITWRAERLASPDDTLEIAS
jgi:hypothetical protein